MTRTLVLALLGTIACTPETKTPEPEPVKAEAPAAEAPGAADKSLSGRVVPSAPETVPENGWTTTESGLMFHDFAEGTGELPAEGSTVVVDYSGFLEDGTLFDTSMRRSRPFVFSLGKGQVIKGWDEGIATMKVGGRRQLKIPSDLAYGPAGRPPKIPPASTLIFDVELKEIRAPRVAPETWHAVAEGDWTVTESGLKYYDIEVGGGAAPSEGKLVEVDYTGWLTDNTKFDSSLDRPDPIRFPLGKGRVIPGWDEGIASMKVGGKRVLYIPFSLAYGEAGRPPVIPEKADLIFQVELISSN